MKAEVKLLISVNCITIMKTRSILRNDIEIKLKLCYLARTEIELKFNLSCLNWILIKIVMNEWMNECLIANCFSVSAWLHSFLLMACYPNMFPFHHYQSKNWLKCEEKHFNKEQHEWNEITLVTYSCTVIHIHRASTLVTYSCEVITFIERLH